MLSDLIIPNDQAKEIKVLACECVRVSPIAIHSFDCIFMIICSNYTNRFSIKAISSRDCFLHKTVIISQR